ncbi:MAG: FAD binding domain-containing protein [Treponema sp.]|jgi:CO/xanthine dehydrogenase FAD-binding subunit|nr:FAD binding domain-containing protein [Treponema sp.]
MDVPRNQIFFPQSLQELFGAWRRFPDAAIYAGGTGILGFQGQKSITLPSNIISLERLEELYQITKTERYLEIGAMVTLNDIINLGKNVPEAFTLALKNSAGPQRMNLATLGGNICRRALRRDTAAALIALDARYELRTAQQARWISAFRFSQSDAPAINSQELLTRIRIPLELWNYSRYKKMRDPYEENPGGSVAFIARIEKNALMDIRVVCAGETILRDKNSEAFLVGKRLPLDRRVAAQFTEFWRVCLETAEKIDAMPRAVMLNFIESAIVALSG